MFSFKSIITITLAIIAVTNGSPAAPSAPGASTAPPASKLISPPALSAAESLTGFGNFTIRGIAPTKVVPYVGGKEGVFIGYFDVPKGSEAVSNAKEVNSLQPRACGDNWNGGCDYNNNRAIDDICGELVGWLRGRNNRTTLGFCSSLNVPYFGLIYCCTTFRGGYSVPAWALANGVDAIRGRCNSGGYVSGWINSARLDGQCAAQCLSSRTSGC